MKILTISLAFPPKNDPECIQTGKYVKYLAKQDCHIDVFTSNQVLNMPIDNSLKNYISPSVKVHDFPIPENRYVNFAKSKLNPTLLQSPDPKSSWLKKTSAMIKKAEELKPDIIYSRSFPITSAMVAKSVSSRLNLPWVMHLSDPWADYPLTAWTEKAKSLNQSWEKESFEQASLISIASPQMTDFYKKKYPQHRDKIKFFPNVYDDEVQSGGNDLSNKDTFKIVCTGGFAGARSPLPLLNPITKIVRENPELKGKIEVIFMGGLDRNNRELFEKAPSGVKHLGLVDFMTSVEWQKKANLLVVLDTPTANNQFLPSKIIDYMAAQIPILGITSSGSVTSKIVHNNYGKCFEHEAQEEISNFILTSYKHFNEGKPIFEPNKPDTQYSAVENTIRLWEEMKRLIRK